MQTFVPFISWSQSAECLDDQRAGKQRLEAWQIFEHLIGDKPDFYPHHPAMDMWRGYESALAVYGMQSCMEWWARDKNDSIQFRFHNRIAQDDFDFKFVGPPWRNDTNVMRSHRSNLFRKDPAHYAQFRTAPHNMPYLWPFCSPDLEDGYEIRISAADKKRLKTGERVLPAEMEDKVANL